MGLHPPNQARAIQDYSSTPLMRAARPELWKAWLRQQPVGQHSFSPGHRLFGDAY